MAKGHPTPHDVLTATLLERVNRGFPGWVSIGERTARAAHTFSPAERHQLYGLLFKEMAKVLLMDLNHLFVGTAGDESPETYLPYRLCDEQRRRAREAGAVLWEIIQVASFQATPIASAKADQSFQQFLTQTIAAPSKRRRQTSTRRGRK